MGGSSGSDQTIGFRYFMGLHMAIAHGPVTRINQIYVAERSLDISPQTANATITVNKPQLMGGDEKEGGIVGDLDLEFGGPTQSQNIYLASQYGSNNTPSYRGVTCVVFRESNDPSIQTSNYVSSSSGGYLTAISPYPKKWAFSVTDIPGGVFNPTKQNINGGANGGHIIYDCLTNSDWGLGLPPTDLDVVSFTATTNTLYDEQFSLSMVYAQQSTMEDFVNQILTHINAVLYTNRKTGLFVLKLIRDDYNPNTLPIFDETNIASLVSFERPAFSEMVNEIVISYRRQNDFTDTTITAQDLSSIQAQEGVVSQTLSFAGIDNDTIASQIAQRELKQSSTPLARIRMIANREAWNVNPGDVIKLSWAAYGISEVVFRVGSVDYGSLESGLVGIDAVEDIFALPANTYLVPQDTGWQDEVNDPIPAPTTRALELPFFVIETTFLTEFINALVDDSALLQSIAEYPAIATVSFQLNTRISPMSYAVVAQGQFSPTAELVGTLDEQTKLSIPIQNFKGGLGEVVIGGYAYLNDEVLRVDSVDLTNNLLNVGRGYLDSVPRSHAAGSIIYFADSNSAVDPTVYSESDIVDAKVLTQTSIGTLPLASAATDTVVMSARRNRPYNGAQIRIGGLYFPAALIDQISVVVTWTYQDRTQQLTAAGQDWYEISLGSPEIGTTYTIRYYDEAGPTLLFTESGITGKQSSFTPDIPTSTTITMRVEVEAVRDGILSYKLYSHTFDYTRPLAIRTLPNSDVRVLPNTDRRILP